MSKKELLFFSLGTFPSEKRGERAGIFAPGEMVGLATFSQAALGQEDP